MPTGNPLFRADPLSQQASALNSVRIPIQLVDQPREGKIASAFGDSADFNVDSLLSAENKAELFRVRLMPGTRRNLAILDAQSSLRAP